MSVLTLATATVCLALAALSTVLTWAALRLARPQTKEMP